MKSKVVLIPCSSYEEETLYRCLKQGLELLGGLESLIKKNEKVLFKPNLVRSAKRERAVVTDPAVMENVFRIFREQGYEHLACGDSCGIGSAGKAMKECHMDAALEKYGVELKEFQDEQRVETQRGRTLTLAKDVLEADALVSVCKMKTHALERVTGAVKNQYGCICGMHKAMGHTQYPNADIFARMLADLNLTVKPRLYIMDGITAMEGNGPTSGDPIPMNVLLFSEDPVALDTVFCHLVYLDPELVPTNVHGEKMGLGTWKSSQIDVVREPLLRNRLARDMETGNSMWTGKGSREKPLWTPSASLAFSGKNHTSSKTSAANAASASAPVRWREKPSGSKTGEQIRRYMIIRSVSAASAARKCVRTGRSR